MEGEPVCVESQSCNIDIKLLWTEITKRERDRVRESGRKRERERAPASERDWARKMEECKREDGAERRKLKTTITFANVVEFARRKIMWSESIAQCWWVRVCVYVCEWMCFVCVSEWVLSFYFCAVPYLHRWSHWGQCAYLLIFPFFTPNSHYHSHQFSVAFISCSYSGCRRCCRQTTVVWQRNLILLSFRMLDATAKSVYSGP